MGGSFSSICSFMTKYMGDFFGNKVKFINNFFDNHFIDMSFRMLFYRHCSGKKRLFCLKVKVNKRRNLYIYLVSFFES
ncbi:hypothetical protein COF37_21385 [Bacillus wiedmannii]|nr:hypothetical protein COF37_21385 [Bacillus wiedmannii]